MLSSSVFKRKVGCCSMKYSVQTQEQNGCVVNKIHNVILTADLRVANFSLISSKASVVTVAIINKFL